MLGLVFFFCTGSVNSRGTPTVNSASTVDPWSCSRVRVCSQQSDRVRASHPRPALPVPSVCTRKLRTPPQVLNTYAPTHGQHDWRSSRDVGDAPPARGGAAGVRVGYHAGGGLPPARGSPKVDLAVRRAHRPSFRGAANLHPPPRPVYSVRTFPYPFFSLSALCSLAVLSLSLSRRPRTLPPLVLWRPWLHPRAQKESGSAAACVRTSKADTHVHRARCVHTTP